MRTGFGIAVGVVFLAAAVGVASRMGSSAGATAGGNTVAEFISQARAAFKDEDDERGAAFLSAALLQDPANDAALDLFRERAADRFQAAIHEHDWELAQVHLAGYDSTVRSALKGATQVSVVGNLLTRQREISTWEDNLRKSRDGAVLAEMNRFDDNLPTANRVQLRAFESRLKQVQLDQLGSRAQEAVNATTNRLLTRKHVTDAEDLVQQYSQLKDSASKAGNSSDQLLELRARAQHLHARVIETMLGGTARLQGDCEGLITQLDQRLQVISIRQMQQIADADALDAIRRVENVLKCQEGIETRKQGKWHEGGKNLAAAEMELARIDRLCSLEVQRRATLLQQDIRKRALTYRSNQQKEYNLWAIDVLELTMNEYEKNKGFVKDNKEGLKDLLGEHLGGIDPQALNPVTHALFAEMFTKILSDLNNDMKVEATRAVEKKAKVPLSAF